MGVSQLYSHCHEDISIHVCSTVIIDALLMLQVFCVLLRLSDCLGTGAASWISSSGPNGSVSDEDSQSICGTVPRPQVAESDGDRGGV